MKKNKTFLEYKLVILYCFLTTAFFSQVGINTVTPSLGSILDVKSSEKEVLITEVGYSKLKYNIASYSRCNSKFISV